MVSAEGIGYLMKRKKEAKLKRISEGKPIKSDEKNKSLLDYGLEQPIPFKRRKCH